MTETKIRIAQQKSRDSVTILLPTAETGIEPGDGVIFEVLDNGKVLLTRVKKEGIEKEAGIISYINKLLHVFGLNKYYELKKKNEITASEPYYSEIDDDANKSQSNDGKLALSD